MALRGDYLRIKVQQHSSTVGGEYVAETTSVSVDFGAEALETTSQESGLNASFIGGKVTGTVGGDYLLASDGTNFSNLFSFMNAGTTIEVDVYRSGSLWIAAEGVITNLSLSGGNSDQLATGSYSINLSDTITVS